MDSEQKRARDAALRALPAMDRLLLHPAWDAHPDLGRAARTSACRQAVGSVRQAILAGDTDEADCDVDRVALRAVGFALGQARPLIRPVVNATGVILHTNLGRAPLPQAAIDAISATAGRYVNLEMDLVSGRRDDRMDRLGSAFAALLGCGDVVIANNNAAAVFLALSALAPGGAAVAISRGELVEIGGSFRMPDIMAASGARMVEVGTTNRTHLRDYQEALAAGARVVLKVHKSNFEQVGFTKDVAVEDLATLARAHGALLVHDLGSGLLRSSPALGDDCVRRSLDAGADLVLFSGDKLLGGPQSGIAAGTREVIARLRSCPVLRLVRPGKLTMLALEATLRAWQQDPARVPCAEMAARTLEDLQVAAADLAERARLVLGDRARVDVVEVDSTPGGGSSASIRLPSRAVAITPQSGSDEGLAAALRQGDPAVMGRIERGRVLLDTRTLLPGDADLIAAALSRW